MIDKALLRDALLVLVLEASALLYWLFPELHSAQHYRNVQHITDQVAEA